MRLVRWSNAVILTGKCAHFRVLPLCLPVFRKVTPLLKDELPSLAFNDCGS